jgi:hypothetical protein
MEKWTELYQGLCADLDQNRPVAPRGLAPYSLLPARGISAGFPRASLAVAAGTASAFTDDPDERTNRKQLTIF